MRKTSIVVLVALSSGAGFWLGRAHVNRPDPGTAGPTITGTVRVVGATMEAGPTVPANSLTVGGDLHMRSLPDGKLVLDGNLNVRPFSN